VKFRKIKAEHVQLDLIPMIDIVFQLILFFLVSTTFALLPAISLRLPSSTTAESTSGGSITITAEKDGTLWFNTEKVNITELGTYLSSYELSPEERKTFPVRLEADDLVTNGTIVGIFDLLRSNGFAAVNLRTTGIKK